MEETAVYYVESSQTTVDVRGKSSIYSAKHWCFYAIK
jgi:hypothetical protein